MLALMENATCQAPCGENAAIPIHRKNVNPEQPAAQMKDIMKNTQKSAKNMIGANVRAENIPASAIT